MYIYYDLSSTPLFFRRGSSWSVDPCVDVPAAPGGAQPAQPAPRRRGGGDQPGTAAPQPPRTPPRARLIAPAPRPVSVIGIQTTTHSPQYTRKPFRAPKNPRKSPGKSPIIDIIRDCTIIRESVYTSTDNPPRCP